MSGAIRTKEKCPFGCRFDPDLAFFCPAHKTFPSRLYFDVSWRGHRIKVYSDDRGMPIDSYQRALLVQSVIDAEIREGSFDPTKYIRQDQEKFWARNLLDRFLNTKIDELAPSYRKDYRRMATIAAGFFGVKDAREIRKIDLANYKAHLEASGISGKTVKNYLDHFKAFLRWCLSDLEIIPRVPIFPRVELAPRPFRWLAQEDQLRIFGHIPETDQPIIHFLALHGCRPAEARALRVRDLNLAAGVITISASFSGRVLREKRKGRGSKPYTLPIHPEIMEFMAWRASQALPGAFLFINPKNGEPYSQNKLRRVWDATRRASGLDSSLRLYDATRHSFASQLRAAGIGIEAIRDHLGHSDIRTTLKYAHGNLSGMRANLERLSMKKIAPMEGKDEIRKVPRL